MVKIKYISILLLVILPLLRLSIPAASQNLPEILQKADTQKMKQWADSIFDTMTLDEKIGQMFIITAPPDPGHRDQVIKYIDRQKIGGILFSKGTIEDQAASINHYQQHTRIPLFIALDGEWGLSMRFEGAPRFPRNMTLGAVDDLELIRQYGAEVGRECRLSGIHINFAPVVDINTNPLNPVIGTRSFGENPQDVSDRAIAYARGLESQNIISVAKHFPGHGDTSEDSHKTLPTVNKNRQQLHDTELHPFQQYINARLAGIMTAHLAVPALDSITRKPASLSPLIVQNLLQTQMNFTGLTFTDALAMKGAATESQNPAVDAIKAGNDIILNPADPETQIQAVKKAVETGQIPIQLIEEKSLKILHYKYAAGLNNQQTIKTKNIRQNLNTEYTSWLIRELNNKAVTLLKNNNREIPIKNLDNIALLTISTANETTIHKTLSQYTTITQYTITPKTTPKTIDTIFRQLRRHNTIICTIHTTRTINLPQLPQLAREKTLHIAFLTTPYTIPKYQQTINHAATVTTAYENTPDAQQSTAELIMGGIPALGKLPVTINNMYPLHTTNTTTKTRLSHHSPIHEHHNPDALLQIDQIALEGINSKAYPGCQILIARNSTIIYHKTFGTFDYAGTHPVQTDDLYDLASLTKALATTPAIMKLHEQQKINLDQPISIHIPQLNNTPLAGITIRSLLHHETPLPPYLPFYQQLIDPQSYTGALFSSRRTPTHNIHFDTNTYARSNFRFHQNKTSRTPREGIETKIADNLYTKNNIEQDILSEIINTTLRKNSNYQYSDLNFILLKTAIENITSQTLDHYLYTEYSHPLGANTTTYHPLALFPKNRIAPTEHDQFWRNQILIGHPHDEAAAILGGVSGNAGLFSSAGDIAKILQMLLWNGQYGSREYLTPQTVKLFTQTKSPNSRRGLGFDHPDPNRTDLSQVSTLTFGHTGYTGTCFWVDPDKQLIYIFLSNRVYPSRTNRRLATLKIRERIQDAIYKSMEN